MVVGCSLIWSDGVRYDENGQRYGCCFFDPEVLGRTLIRDVGVSFATVSQV